MLDNKQILEYAVKGLAADIDKLKNDVIKGKKLIEQIDNGQKPKTAKTRQEVASVISAKLDEIEKLEKELANIRWQLDVEMN